VQRELDALELRAGGATFDEIAHRLGFANRGSAQKAYARAMERAGTRDLSMGERRTLELHRLERMYQMVWPKASRGDLAAVREARRISEAIQALAGLRVAPVGGLSQGPHSDGDRDEDSAEVVSERRVAELRERRERDAAERAARAGGS
jgi:hypothetical protein